MSDAEKPYWVDKNGTVIQKRGWWFGCTKQESIVLEKQRRIINKIKKRGIATSDNVMRIKKYYHL